MTRTTNARVAGVTFLFYIAVGITSLVLFGRATTGVGIAAKLASIAQHATEVRLVVLLNLLASLSALVLGVTLYAITRDEDRDLAMLALLCRVAEGLSSFAGISTMLGVLWLATAIGPNAPGIEATQALGAFFLRGSGGVGAIFFALGSTLFAGLLLRGRMIPAAPGLAWLPRIGPARRDPPSAACRTVRRYGRLVQPGHLARVATHVAVRGGVCAVADRQRRCHSDWKAIGMRWVPSQ